MAQRLPPGTRLPELGGNTNSGGIAPANPPQPIWHPPSPIVRNTHPFIFYIITLILSTAATWGLSILASILFFDENIFGFSKIPGWFDSIEGFLLNITPYLILLGGIIGCFWYNIKKSDFNSFKDIIFPVISAIVACLILCLGAAILTLVIIIVIAILKVIIPIIIGIIVVLLLIGG